MPVPQLADLADSMSAPERCTKSVIAVIGVAIVSAAVCISHAHAISAFVDVFPRLRERMKVQAGHLSGGEQQMLTLFRTLLGNPGVILIDEPTEGLAPKVVDAVAECIVEMRRRGLAVLLLEQKLAMALRLTDRFLIMGRGEIVFSGTQDEFEAAEDMRKRWISPEPGAHA